MNKTVKIILEISHSFATLTLSKGMPIESVSRVLGHTNIVTTQIYAKNTSQKLNADLTMLGDKLNASFKASSDGTRRMQDDIITSSPYDIPMVSS